MNCSLKAHSAVLTAWFVFVLVASPAIATPISNGGSFSTGSEWFYDGDDVMDPPGMWNLNTRISGTCGINNNDGVRVYSMKANEVTFSWTGNLLTNDASRMVDGAMLADGYFGSGGTLTVTGPIWEKGHSSSTFTGVLLTANMGAFHVQERTPTTNDMELVDGVPMTVTGGWLHDTATLTRLIGTYTLSFTTSGIQTSDLGSFDNFDPSLKMTAYSTLMQFSPEPTSALLVLVGVAGVISRRRVGKY